MIDKMKIDGKKRRYQHAQYRLYEKKGEGIWEIPLTAYIAVYNFPDIIIRHSKLSIKSYINNMVDEIKNKQ